MGKFFESIPPDYVPWLLKQEVFWVATAPLDPEAHVNVSPKGVRDSFHVLSPTRVWYQDLTGSGVETIAHLRENGRITLLFSAFEGPPRIVRLFGTGTVHEFGSAEYDALIPPEHRRPGSRAAIVIDVHKVGYSCGYAVPYYEFKGHRQVLLDSACKTERAERMQAYWGRQNTQSIDGLPALAVAHTADRPLTFREELKVANAKENGEIPDVDSNYTNGHATLARANGTTVAVKAASGRRRVEEWAVAFALGVVAAAIYVRFQGVA
ncbi:hypothetical protein BD413DRAFT_613479 [Trametes elegans]|nr:hypothetical protein BD413DRAFT_613479 [Trametes elegans]